MMADGYECGLQAHLLHENYGNITCLGYVGHLNWSRRADSNRRPSRWQQEALPLSYVRMEEAVGFEPTVGSHLR